MFKLTRKKVIAKDYLPPRPVMSLIPSESYSFPDHFTSTVTPSRKPKPDKVEAANTRKKPHIVALPDPEPEPELVVALEPDPVTAVEPDPVVATEPERAVAMEPVFESELMSEIWEPEVAEAKAPPPPPLPRPAPRPPQPVAPRPPAKMTPQAAVQVQPPRKPAPAPAQMRPVSPRPAPAPPKPAPTSARVVVPSRQSDFFEMFSEDGY